jgi:hypothetical protein
VTDPFAGFPVQAFEFYDALSANNTKPWWNEHRGEYDEFVKAPFTALTAELEPTFGAAKLFRPYNDTRFHKGEPLKTHQGATVMLEDGVGLYVQVSATGLMTAGGWYSPGGEQLRRYREAVDGPAGAELERLMKVLPKTFAVDGNQLATKPKGVDADHPRLDLLRNRRLTAARNYAVEPWISTRKTLSVVRKDWNTILPLLEWLADHVGPAEDPSNQG